MEGSDEMSLCGLRSLRGRGSPPRGVGALLVAIASAELALVLMLSGSGSIVLQVQSVSAQSMSPTPQPFQPQPGCDSPATPVGQANPSDEPEPMSAI